MNLSTPGREKNTITVATASQSLLNLPVNLQNADCYFLQYIHHYRQPSHVERQTVRATKSAGSQQETVGKCEATLKPEPRVDTRPTQHRV